MEEQKKPRAYFGKLGAWASISLNLVLFVLKLILGLISGSVALIADAFHTLSDLATSFVVLISFHITAKPSDEKHPFGHGRAEFISAIIMLTLLAITAFELLQGSIKRILHPIPFLAPWWIIAIIFVTVLLKEALAIFAMFLSRKINSDTLKADAWHHRLDAITSLLVVISFIFSHYHFPYLDGPSGVLISFIIVYSAYQIARRPMDNLLGTVPDDEILDKIEKITLNFPEIRGLHDVVIHNYGENMAITLHIEIDEKVSFLAAHRLAEKVEKKLSEDLQAYVTIHFDPAMERTPLYRSIEEKVQEFCRSTPECDSFHDLRIFGRESHLKVYLDLVASRITPTNEEKELVESCKNFIAAQFPTIEKISVKVEPRFSVSRKSWQNER
jgi:cation diffusion facilitator family transporter